MMENAMTERGFVKLTVHPKPSFGQKQSSVFFIVIKQSELSERWVFIKGIHNPVYFGSVKVSKSPRSKASCSSLIRSEV